MQAQYTGIFFMTSQLEPGASYVYERDGSRVYARKIGDTERILIGEDYYSDDKSRITQIVEEWAPIVQAAEHNPALQDALERAKIIYELSKTQEPLFHHPV
jgi:hypothetical protein